MTLGSEKKGSNYTIISSKVPVDNGPEIKIDWKISKNPEKPLIRDLNS